MIHLDMNFLVEPRSGNREEPEGRNSQDVSESELSENEKELSTDTTLDDLSVPALRQKSNSTSVINRVKPNSLHIPRSVSCTNIANVKRRSKYSHVESRVRQYIREMKLKSGESTNVSSVGSSLPTLTLTSKERHYCSAWCIAYDVSDEEDELPDKLKHLKAHNLEKERMLAALQEKYKDLLMKHAEAKNTIDRLRICGDSAASRPSPPSNSDKSATSLGNFLDNQLVIRRRSSTRTSNERVGSGTDATPTSRATQTDVGNRTWKDAETQVLCDVPSPNGYVKRCSEIGDEVDSTLQTLQSSVESPEKGLRIRRGVDDYLVISDLTDVACQTESPIRGSQKRPSSRKKSKKQLLETLELADNFATKLKVQSEGMLHRMQKFNQKNH